MNTNLKTQPARDWFQAGDYFKFRDHNVFYRVLGSGSPLLPLHGYPTSSWDWAKIAPILAQKYTLHMPDLLGFGFSDF